MAQDESPYNMAFHFDEDLRDVPGAPEEMAQALAVARARLARFLPNTGGYAASGGRRHPAVVGLAGPITFRSAAIASASQPPISGRTAGAAEP